LPEEQLTDITKSIDGQFRNVFVWHPIQIEMYSGKRMYFYSETTFNWTRVCLRHFVCIIICINIIIGEGPFYNKLKVYV